MTFVLNKRKRFPPLWKFKTFSKRQRHKKLLSIINIISNSSSIDECLSQIQNISQRQLNTIERRTKLQSEEEDWFHYRKGVITGTLTYRVSKAVKRRQISNSVNTSISKITYFPLYYPAIIWGKNSEKYAINAFIKKIKPKHQNLNVGRAGLKLDDTHHFIGASIDGLVECSCCEPAILEVKCPYSIRDGTVADDGYKLQYLTEDLQLKTSHHYYFQLQTYLGVYKLKKGYFCVYTPRDVLILSINFDENFWNSLKGDICTYYKEYYLKELFSN